MADPVSGSRQAPLLAAYRRGLLGLGEVALWYGQDRALLEAELGPPDDLEPAEDYWSTGGQLFPGGAPGPAS